MSHLFLIAQLFLYCNFTVENNRTTLDKKEASRAFEFLNDIRTNKNSYIEEFPFLKDAKIKRTKLIWNAKLSEVAENKALDMANRNYFDHIDPEGYGINHFIRKSGYKLNKDWTKKKNANYFESLCAGVTDGEDAIGVLLIDKNTPSLGHRKHLLGIGEWNSSLTEIGIGFARAKHPCLYESYVCVIIAKHN